MAHALRARTVQYSTVQYREREREREREGRIKRERKGGRVLNELIRLRGIWSIGVR
jgi:hypothetical protein